MENRTKIKSVIILLLLTILNSSILLAQWGTLGNQIKNGLSNKAQQKIKQEINDGVDKAYDKSKQKTKESVKNSKEKDDESNSNSSSDVSNENNKNSSSNSTANSSLKAYGKFDFIPGEKVIAQEDFTQDAIGDFPSKWNTNGSGELVTIDGQQGK